MAETKRCPRCETVKLIDEFGRDRTRRDGRKGWCKVCNRAYNAEHYGGEYGRAADRRWRERNPERARELSRLAAARWRAHNPEKAYLAYTSWRERNPQRDRVAPRSRQQQGSFEEEWRRAADRRRRRRHRARLAGVQVVVFPSLALRARLDYFGWRCWLCGSDGRIEVDHVKPITAGGGDLLCNLRPICRPCNKWKAGRWPFNPDEHRRIIGLEFVA